jgi:hypothetical protein
MASFATRDIFSAAETLKDIKQVYSAQEVKQLDDAYEYLHEDLLDSIWGDSSRISYEEFFDKTEQNGKWIFDTT